MLSFLKSALYTLLLLTILSPASAQQRFTISGSIEDEESGEKIIGASVFDLKSKKGTTTNTYGFFSLSLPPDSVDLLISSLGATPVKMKIKLDKNISLDLKLKSSTQLQTVEITEDRLERIEERSQMSMIEIPIEQIKSIPALLGEVDVLKVIQLLPGVQSGAEGTSGFYVRGGGPDQNLILLDGAPVYNASHLFGFFSVFNADAIKNVDLIKGGFPAHYGGRLSSVLDITMKEGNMRKYHGEGTIGIISAKLAIEGPIIKDKCSFIVSGRRTYIDLLAQPLIKKQTGGMGAGYYFYDVNAKVNYILSPKDRLFLSVYTGDDQFYAKQKSEYSDLNTDFQSTSTYRLGWGNLTSTARWNHIINDKLFANTSFIYSKFRFLTDIEQLDEVTSSGVYQKNEFNLKYLSGINDASGKIDFDYHPNPDHYIKFGIGDMYHTFNTGATQYKMANTGTASVDTSMGVDDVYAHEASAYIEDDFLITGNLKVNGGIHTSLFHVQDENYYSIQPRISARYLMDKGWSLKASYATMQQYIHLLSNSTIGLPTDLWVPSTKTIKPEFSQQVAAGFAKSLFSEKYELSIETYYKKMDNILDYLEGANFMDSQQKWEDKVDAGQGWAYGTEFFLQKKKGKFTGWIGYTLSWSKRQFPNINEGRVYPYKYDRRHDMSVVLSYKTKDGIDFAVTWVYGTGNSISLPIAEYPASGWSPAGNVNGGGFMGQGYDPSYAGTIQYYGDKNSFRMAAYHRLDVGINFTKEKAWGTRTWSIGAYNAYNRKNPFFLYSGYTDTGKKVFKQVTLFPIIPSISYSFKF